MITGVFKPAFRILSPSGRRGKLFVFIFHRVVDQNDALLPSEPDAVQFDWMMNFVKNNFRVLPFGEAVSLLNNDKLPAAAACVTFDDGYQDNFSVAMPILQRHGLVGTFFISTGFLNGGRMWNDDIIEAIRASPNAVVDWSEFGLDQYDLTTHQGRILAINAALGKLKYFPHMERNVIAREIAHRSGIPGNSTLMMSSDEVRLLRAAGMELGAHTHSHPILSNLSAREAESEIAQGKEELEAILRETVTSFAYPNGNSTRDLGMRDVAIVKRLGFLAAATTDFGVAGSRTNPFFIPRFTPWDRTPHRFALRCAITLGKTLGR
ncbi:MAG: polysaccharide deacetylase family protein [Azonexaceae bacterium]|nr:polysaccharide deacetylase family protein [Azonexaceae bacterium]